MIRPLLERRVNPLASFFGVSVLQEKIQHLNRKVEEEAKMQAESDQWITEFKNHINLEELTYDVVRGLIEQIEVNQDGSINIFYRFGKH